MGSDIHDAFTGRVNSLRAWGRPGGPSNNPDGHGTHVCGCTHSHAAVILHTLQLGATLRPRRLPPRPGPLRLVRQRAATAHSQSTAFPVASSPATMSSSSSGTGGGGDGYSSFSSPWKLLSPSSSGRSRTGGHITACQTNFFSHGRSRHTASWGGACSHNPSSMLSSGIWKSTLPKQLEGIDADVKERYAAAQRARTQDPEVKGRRAAYLSVSIYASQIVASLPVQCNVFTASYDTLA